MIRQQKCKILLSEWQVYKNENSIYRFNFKKISTKFDVLDSSGDDVGYDLYKALLNSNNVEVLNLNFNIYDKTQSQYTMDIVGDFIIDNKEYKNVSLSGYNEKQYFTSWQILSNFSITIYFELFDTFEVVNEKNDQLLLRTMKEIKKMTLQLFLLT